MLKKLKQFQFREVTCRLPEQMKCYCCDLSVCLLQFHFYFLQDTKYFFKAYCYHKHNLFCSLTKDQLLCCKLLQISSFYAYCTLHVCYLFFTETDL